jgi:hypothetical protein
VEERAGLLEDESETMATGEQQHTGGGVSTVVRSPSTSTVRASTVVIPRA